ncbi:MAG: Gfo/Idh/MocA family oxidoreductase [Desulfovibrio sp.]|nr:Gfo/Idh/MocA family oxidoreductase [Desulfovibrio sp.]MBI4958476.1 Gfo/Idh/MocA family oxidoreductase [Desulfovibrio sp.]
MRTITCGIIGLGFIGPAHIDALVRTEGVRIAALADVNEDNARAVADRFSIPKVHSDYRELLKDESIEVVHNCTPNHLHFPINMAIIAANKHVVGEKPLAISGDEARQLVVAAERAGIVNAVCYVYRYFPMVQQAAALVRKNDMGRIFAVHGTYLQDWLLYETDWNWRLDPSAAGQSRAVADIGTHCMDLARFVMGKRITRVMADLFTVHSQRKKPLAQHDTFSGTLSAEPACTDVDIKTEDQAHILTEFEDGARGIFCISQVAAGRKNHLSLEVWGSKKSLWWDQERPNELYLGCRNEANQLLMKDPQLLEPEAREYAHYPGGHTEGYPTCMRNLFRNIYRRVREPDRPVDFATFRDGCEIDLLVEAILRSCSSKQWETVHLV